MWRLILALGFLAAPLVSAGPAHDEYASRRQSLRDRLGDGVIVLMGAKEPDYGHIRSAFFQESNFYYLTGWDEPGAILVIAPEEEVLFIPRRSPAKERWTGARAGPRSDDIQQRTGFENVRPAETFESWFAAAIEGAAAIYTLTEAPYAGRLQAMLPRRPLRDAAPAIARLRMIKSAAEIALLRRSADITMRAHRAAWARLAPGLYEYQVAAAMMAVYFGAGCRRNAYAPIVGSGPNSTVLHYSRNSRRLGPGELVLMDVGAECSYYASDITRTVPAGGTFSDRQREIYNIVLGAQQAVIAAVKPGMTFRRQGPHSLYRVAFDYIDSHGRDLHGQRLGRYFTHGIGHHVGLDVHDANDPSIPLGAGMVITIEPGVYIPEEDIGIRIEDMVLVTDDGCEVLTADLPKTARQIEKAVGKGF